MELNFVLTVLDRSKADQMAALYSDNGVPLVLTMLGRGTATHEQLSLQGLEATEKAVVAAVADNEKTRLLMRSAKRKLFLDIPGNGVMMVIPVKSVGGGKTLAYLSNNTVSDGSVPNLHFEYELILVVLNQSYMDDVMNAARSAGASGGTVLHAKGTGARYAQKFFGVALANEKEVVLIAARASEKAAIMRAIAEQTGPETPAGAITFSLPNSAVAGLRNPDRD